MAKYTIEVESIYVLKTVAPIAAFLEDREGNFSHVMQTLPNFLGELLMVVTHLESIEDFVDMESHEWRLALTQFEALAREMHKRSGKHQE